MKTLCVHTGARGGPCRSWALPGNIYCGKHLCPATRAPGQPIEDLDDKGSGKGSGKSKGKSKDPWDGYDTGGIHCLCPGITDVCVEWEHIDVQAVLNACALTATRQAWYKWGESRKSLLGK